MSWLPVIITLTIIVVLVLAASWYWVRLTEQIEARLQEREDFLEGEDHR